MQVLVLLLLIFVAVWANDEDTERVMGGTDAKITNFPYMAAIRKKGQELASCGATILSSRWLVSAAHCFIGFHSERPITDFEILSMTDDLKKPGARTNIERLAYSNPKFNPYMIAHNDIVMIKVTDDLKGSPIKLPTEGQDFTGQTAILTGFGRQGKTADTRSLILQFLTVPILENRLCVQEYKQFFIEKTNICIGKGIASGDSGGPVVVPSNVSAKHTLVGIVSFGKNNPDVIKVLTRVSAYVQFIQETLKS